MTLKDISSRLSGVSVQEVPNTPPLNKFGGSFENGWEIFFSDLNNFIQQMQSVQQVEGMLVNRSGNVVTVTGVVGVDPVDLGVAPACEFTMDGVHVDAFGKISATENRTFSLSFVAKEM